MAEHGRTLTSVHVVSRDHPALPGTLRARLEQLRISLREAVADGFAQDWADYRYRVGLIRGLQDAIEACAEIEDDLRGA